MDVVDDKEGDVSVFRKEPEWDEEEMAAVCSCHDQEHIIFLNYWTDDDTLDADLTVEPHLNPEWRWWRRIWLAVKYVFGYRSRYGEYESISLNRKTARAVYDFIGRFLAICEEGEDAKVG